MAEELVPILENDYKKLLRQAVALLEVVRPSLVYRSIGVG
jgi:hypothetical protein